jgi:hypothetical protein
MAKLKMVDNDSKSLYSDRLNVGRSGIQMVIFWTKFVSGFQMVVTILFLAWFSNSKTDLDLFHMKYIFHLNNTI